MAECNENSIFLVEDDDLENAELLQFYHRALPRLKLCEISELGPIALREMTVTIESTLLHKNDWKEYAYRLGIEANHVLNSIESASYHHRESGLYIALTTIAVQQRMSIGHLVLALLDIPREDVLYLLRPVITSILKKKSTEIKRCQFDKPNQFSKGSDTTDSTTKDFSKLKITDCENSAASESCSVEGTSCVADKKCDESLQGNLLCSKDSLTVKQSTCGKELISTVIPSAPTEVYTLRVFIMHTENETSIADELSLKLRKEGILVRTLNDMDILFRINMDDAFRALLQEVDFIIPIVSTTLLQQVHAPQYGVYLEFQDAWYNRNLYHLMQNEFSFNRCLNFRVKAVVLPDFDKSFLKHERLFSSALRLWEEVPKLITVLQKTMLLLK